MDALGIILARAGSKGLPDKCVRPLLGRPLIEYTFDHVAASERLCAAVLTTDSLPAKQIAHARGVEVIDRPAELASDTATVDAAARHAVEVWEARSARRIDAVVLLYANVPVRAEGVIDRALELLERSGADSVRTVAPVSKQHPDWLHRLDGDRMTQFRPNGLYRRQDLEPLYYHDGAVVAVTRNALFGALRTPEDHQAFLGRDRRALVQRCQDAVDVDEPGDLHVAEALLAGVPSTTPLGVARTDLFVRASAHARPPPISIGQRKLGPGERTYVIAEAGVNHDGDLNKALRLVDVAATAGADAVKFQVFRAAELSTAAAGVAEYQLPAAAGAGAKTPARASQRDMLARLELTERQLVQIRGRCRERGIEFLATPFGLSDMDRLLALDVRAIKIASTDLDNVPLLRKAAETSLPLIVSTGASTAAEIAACVGRLREWGAGERLVLFHCVSRYPAPLAVVNLRAIATLRDTFGIPCGLSDHTTSRRVGAWAVAAGACVLEKHFTLDRGAAGPDHAMSLDAEGLAAYISGVRMAEQALGNGIIGMTELEADVRLAARKSVVAARPLRAGSVLSADALTLKRPAGGIPPDQLDALVGRRIAVNVDSDTTLTWDMIQ